MRPLDGVRDSRRMPHLALCQSQVCPSEPSRPSYPKHSAAKDCQKQLGTISPSPAHRSSTPRPGCTTTLVPTSPTSLVSRGTLCGPTTMAAPGVRSAVDLARPAASLGGSPIPATAAGMPISSSTALVATPAQRSRAATASCMFASKQTSGDREAAQEAASLNLKT